MWSQDPNNDQLKDLITNCFDKEDSKFEKWTPTNWIDKPKFVNSIKDTDLRDWAYRINNLWKDLGRKIKNYVRLHPTNYSLIYVPNSIIIPGGRFREVYYWDSYWIIRGILLSEMNSIAKSMFSYYISMIKTFGHVPNGGRIYTFYTLNQA